MAILAFFPLRLLREDANFAVLEIASALGITLSVYLARRYLDRRPFTSLGLIWNSQAAIDLLFGFLLTGLLMGLVYFAESALGWLQFKDFLWQVQPVSFVAGGLFIALVSFILTGWQEELFSRGYQLQNLTDGLNLFWGVTISSIFFALLHLANPNVSAVAVIGLVAAGFFLAYGYLRTGQLWLSIGLHIGWNFFENTVFGFPVSGIQNLPGMIQQTVRGPELVTGGAFGPEAGLIILPVLALGAGAIYLYSKNRVRG